MALGNKEQQQSRRSATGASSSSTSHHHRRYPSRVIVYVAVATAIQTVVLVVSLFYYDILGQGRECGGSSTSTFIGKKSHYLLAESAIPSLSTQLSPNNDANQSTMKRKNRRKFISYTSSAWELLWLENVNEWSLQKRVCFQIFVAQRNETREFLQSTCSHLLETEDDDETVCVADDSHRPIWMNLANLSYVEPPPEHRSSRGDTDTDEKKAREREELRKRARFQRQRLLPLVPQEPVRYVPHPNDKAAAAAAREIPAIFSKFTFLDEETGETYDEYIEPLVSHLRHPLAFCNTYSFAWMVSRSYIFPPPGPLRGKPKTWLWDAGAGLFNEGKGGPSLAYLSSQWLRNGIAFDEIRAYEASGSVQKFYESLPLFVTSNVEYHNVYVSGRPLNDTTTTDTPQKEEEEEEANEQGPFLPHLIAELTKPEDYVVFKLDIDHGVTEMGIVNYLLNKVENVGDLIDEFLFEHHIDGNYLMKYPWGLHSQNADVSQRVARGVSQRESYEIFLELRRRGVRAHSYV